MRILHITPSLLCSTNGLAVSVVKTVEALHQAGHDVRVAAVRDARVDDIAAKDLSFPIQTVSACGPWCYAPSLAQELLAVYSDQPPEIIHAHGLWLHPQAVARRLARVWGVPLVLTIHGMLEPWRLAYKPWRKRCMWLLSDRHTVHAAELLVATSSMEAEHFAQRGLRNRICVNPLGVTVPVGPVATGKPPWDERKDRRMVLFLSRLHPSKGLDLLVEAVGRLRPQGWHFVIAGPDECKQRSRTEQAVVNAGLSAWFTFLPAQRGPAKWNALRRSDLVVLPSRNENFGLVVAEALACGIPVVTTTATPWQDIYAQGCGWCCSPTVDGLTQALHHALISSPETLKQKGRRGQTWMTRDFTWAQHARRLIDAYNGLSGRH